MKKFFTMNIFFAVLAILGVFATVDTSFKMSKSKLDLPLQNDNIERLEKIYLQKTQKIKTKMAAIKRTKVTPVKYDPVVEEVIELKKKTVERQKEVKKIVLTKKKRSIRKVIKKIVKAKNKIEDALALSYNEQPTQQAIKLRKNIKRVAWTKLDLRLGDYTKKRKYAKIKTPKNFDRISTAQSAQEKSSYKKSEVALNSREVEVKDFGSKNNKDLVFFDYSKKEASSQDSVKEFQTESPTLKLKKKSLRLTGGNVLVPSQKRKESYLAAIGEAFSKKKRRRKSGVSNDFGKNYFGEKALFNKNYECLDEKLLTHDKTFKAEYELTLNEVDYTKSGQASVKNFEIRFHDDPNIYKEDFGSGKINLSFEMSSQISVRRASVVSKGYYRTSMDIVFEPGRVVAKVPVFTNTTFSRILNRNNLKGLDAHVLVELDEKTEDVEIDLSKKYERKLYLDEDYNVVSREDSEYNYVLFVGVEAGNAILNFKRVDRKIINKLVYLAEDEIFYEPNFYAQIKSDSFSVYREGLLTKCKSLVNIKTDKVKPWNYAGKVKKQDLNTVRLSEMTYPVGSKKYVELSYEGLSENIFVGRWNQENIVVPTERYISHVIGEFGNDAQKDSCIMQLNISKAIREINFNGQSKNSHMNMQIKVLDKDGEFYQNFSENSDRVFLLGREEGMINVEIKYTDNSIQYLQSFCSDSTYIVEQL